MADISYRAPYDRRVARIDGPNTKLFRRDRILTLLIVSDSPHGRNNTLDTRAGPWVLNNYSVHSTTRLRPLLFTPPLSMADTVMSEWRSAAAIARLAARLSDEVHKRDCQVPRAAQATSPAAL